MPIQLDWGDYDHNFAIMTFQGKWIGEEFVAAIARLSAMCQSKESPIELMVDMRSSLNPPYNLVTLLHSILDRALPFDIQQVIVISNSSFWRQLYSMIEIMYSKKISYTVHFVTTVDEAYALLEFIKDMG